MVACILCLKDSFPSIGNQITIFSDEGLQLHIGDIISKHFWLRPDIEFEPPQIICTTCWTCLHEFHEFYQQIADAHNYFESKDLVVSIAAEDPLPLDVILKSEDANNCNSQQLSEGIDDNFFDSEIKVEVHDLDLLPQIEVIEDNNYVKNTRAHKRNRQRNTDYKTKNIEKLIKKEQSLDSNVSSNDSDPEIPLAMLIKSSKSDIKNKSLECPNSSLTDKSDLQRKRGRGRPKKTKNNEHSSQSENVKTEQFNNENDNDIDSNFMDRNNFGTDDSVDSSSDSNDSELSLPDIEPLEQYAEIPKRVVVKPKKYRKRPKPLVPPRRMTREEIDNKNALQASYDKVIANFFTKFACPKCSLLVQNFGEMKKHFRASHNDEPGYMTCCGRKFHLRKTLAEHIYVHSNPEHFKCLTCNKIFQDSRALEVHEQTHTNQSEPKDKKVFQCDKCPKTFTTKAAFEYHSYSKHVPKSEFKFTCPECKKKLPTERKLKDHMKYMHDPESAIICDKCGKQVRSQTNLKKHHQIEHSDVPRPEPIPMQCEICGTWLRHLAGLKQHMKTIHEDSGGEHRCHICNKTSTNARALKRHIYHNHECERKFKCTMCEKAFKRPQDLREHTSTHTGEVLYTCPNCPMTFFSNANMYKHRQRLHRAEWESDKKKPVPPNIMQQAVGATAAMKMQQAVGATSAFFAHKLGKQLSTHGQIQSNVYTSMN